MENIEHLSTDVEFDVGYDVAVILLYPLPAIVIRPAAR